MSERGDPEIGYWRVYADADGVTRQKRCTMKHFVLQAIQSGAAPQWQRPIADGAARVLFSVLPANWIGEWHENPKPQWIIPLSGRWFVETMDGRRVEMGPGDISFGGDQGARAREGRKGHRSGALDGAPCAMMIVQFDDAAGAGVGEEE
jgi:hypothetical protein